MRRLSLLSGGERSLVALAFLFAVFRSRPSPFYLMDEVEAALDDVNLSRFLALVHEFRDEAQLIIVSHQKRTMEAADALYGVTMAPGGSSQGRQPEGDQGARRHCRQGARAGLMRTVAFVAFAILVVVLPLTRLAAPRRRRRADHPLHDAAPDDLNGGSPA